MLESIASTAQYTLNGSASAEAILAYREKLKGGPQALGLREVSLNDLVMYAASRVLSRFRELNSHFTGERILRFEQVHLGFAVDTPRGLMVPVIRHASLRSLREIAAEARRLRELCLAERIGPDDLSGATFTVTNLGALGVESFTPILNPPQVAILGVGGIRLQPVEREGSVAFQPRIGLSLTANHQVVDGAPAARFLAALREALERFELLLAG
jgi:pyruvate dehydrogenase E2 component (dihydrolipoamide acetyltransferase)